MAKTITLEGMVKKELLNKSSKSEHYGLVLYTQDNSHYVLKPKEEFCFSEKLVDELNGKDIICNGIIFNGRFIVDNYSLKNQ